MKVFYFVLLLVILPSQLSARAIREDGPDSGGPSGQNSTSLAAPPSQELRSEAPYDMPLESAVCEQIDTQTRYVLDEILTNVSNAGTVSNAFDCCELCQLIPQCHAWNRNRASGECILGYTNDRSLRGRSDLDFDGGFIWGRIQAVALTPPSGTDRRRCQVNTGVRYPRGQRVGQGSVREPRDCCEVCRGSNNCRSWYHSSRRDRCILNGNTPRAFSASDEYTGGTV